MPMIFSRMGEVAIENLLLIRRQHAANLSHALPEQIMALVIKILPRLHYFEPRVAQDIADLIALRGRQIELEIHSLDQPRARHVQVVLAIRHGAESETDQNARESDDDEDPDIRLSWQGRSRSEESPAPKDRSRFQESSSARGTRARRREIHPGCAWKDTPRW